MENSRKSLLVMMFLVVATMGQEPQCSRFHYEEQLLAKMVRLEHEFELFKQKSQDLLEKMGDRLDSVQQGNADLKRESAVMQEKLEENVTAMSLELLELSQDFSALKNIKAETKTKSLDWFLANGISTSSLTEGTTLIFPTTVADENNVYNNKTGEFTAPLDGLYWFSSQLCSSPNKYVRFDIVIAGVTMAASVSNEDTYTTCVMSTAFGIMKAGEKACVKATYTVGSALSDHRYYKNSFSGYKIN